MDINRPSLSPLSKALHWIMAALIIYMLLEGYFKWHKATGVLILLLLVLRISARFTGIVQCYKPRSLQELAAKAAHGALYLLMLAVPLTGLLRNLYGGGTIHFFNLFSIESFLVKDKQLSSMFSHYHGLLADGLQIVLIIHVCAALYHHFILRDDTLRNMLRIRRLS